MLEHTPEEIEPMNTVYRGPEHETASIEERLQANKIEYTKTETVAKDVAEEIPDGALVGWFQGRMKMGPRALGNRSILADPRTQESLDRVNKFVKHREEWRPFAPSMLEGAMDDYLVDPEPART